MEIDARGMACPEPVVKTKNAVESSNPESIRVIVDNPASQQNVRRYLESASYQAVLDQNGDDYIVNGLLSGVPDYQIQTTGTKSPEESGAKKIMVLCSSNRMGHGDDELGKKLMISFIKTLNEMGRDLWRLVFVNNGVKLTTDGSAVLEELLNYEKDQIKILVCGTCLTHFNLLEAKKVGETTNMLDIVTSMQLADSVIKI